jgi:putative endonuclease
MFEHRAGTQSGFANRYNLQYLVYFEETRDIYSAIAREKQLKGWRRSKKEALIGALNPAWADLSLGV